MIVAAAGRVLALTLAMLIANTAACAQQPPPVAEPSLTKAEPMSGERLLQLLARIDPELESGASGARFVVGERQLILVFDAAANRMRVMTPVSKTADLDNAELQRMLQANFDSALDARYAIANDLVWSVFIHPLAELTEQQFASALAQVVTAAATFGGSYSSGALVYGGGDSSELNEELMRELEKRLRTEA